MRFTELQAAELLRDLLQAADTDSDAVLVSRDLLLEAAEIVGDRAVLRAFLQRLSTAHRLRRGWRADLRALLTKKGSRGD